MDFLKGLFEPPSPEEKLRRERQKARDLAARRAHQARQAELERERLAAMPHYRVREVREVLVQAEDMKDAISLASAAFKEGQSSDHSIKWGKPFGVKGDTKGPIQTVDIRAVEDYSLVGSGPHSRACGLRPHEHGIWCSVDCPTCGDK